LEVPYFHVVFTLPPKIAVIAYQNKAVIYDLLFKASAETLLTIAADPKQPPTMNGAVAALRFFFTTTVIRNPSHEQPSAPVPMRPGWL
jgi:hypothetical protein